ncbi:8567_t:CDS:2 [Funneliformis geosporum]|uniref:8567_t:CDS:1 n=1 Tax=Funneliformis geosporum TaxID=1117311 RepID=A0A9W4SHZ0_9GLOM|nr:8567_t:CDS:2 [Funneliformis geosporum]
MSFIRNVVIKWKRISESKSTVSFVLVSIIQALILIYLQFRIMERNQESVDIIMELNETNQLTEYCYNDNAIEVKTLDSKLEKDCPELQFVPEIMKYELPFILAELILGILMGYLSLNLYREFGWNIYKKVGSDISMQKIYRTRLIFAMLLKLDLFIMILFSGLVAPSFYITYKSKSIFQRFLTLVSSVILILVFFFEVIAYRSIETEWKTGINLFIIFWIFALSNFAALSYEVISVSVMTNWYIGFIVGIICSSFALGTFIISIYVRRGFGRGLKGYLDKERNERKRKVSGSKYHAKTFDDIEN